MTDFEVTLWSFRHFYHLDHANACIHTNTVRFSPITFRLAESIGQGFLAEADEVLKDKGAYVEDMGR